jgi:hypothetical protein
VPPSPLLPDSPAPESRVGPADEDVLPQPAVTTATKVADKRRDVCMSEPPNATTNRLYLRQLRRMGPNGHPVDVGHRGWWLRLPTRSIQIMVNLPYLICHSGRVARAEQSHALRQGLRSAGPHVASRGAARASAERARSVGQACTTSPGLARLARDSQRPPRRSPERRAPDAGESPWYAACQRPHHGT